MVYLNSILTISCTNRFRRGLVLYWDHEHTQPCDRVIRTNAERPATSGRANQLAPPPRGGAQIVKEFEAARDSRDVGDAVAAMAYRCFPRAANLF